MELLLCKEKWFGETRLGHKTRNWTVCWVKVQKEKRCFITINKGASCSNPIPTEEDLKSSLYQNLSLNLTYPDLYLDEAKKIIEHSQKIIDFFSSVETGKTVICI